MFVKYIFDNKEMYRQQNTTPIDQLPELSDIAGDGFNRYNPPPAQSPQRDVEKFIRGRHLPPNQSGMVGQQSAENFERYFYGQAPNAQFAPAIQYGQPYGQPANTVQYKQNAEEQPAITSTPPVEECKGLSTKMPINSPTCIAVADHIACCPICSKFYKCDNMPFYIIILILVIVSGLSIKKLLDAPQS